MTNSKGADREIHTKFGELLLETLEEINEPLKNNLNYLQGVVDIGDHKGVLFFLDGALRSMHFQLYGENGNFGNLKEQVDRSENNVMRIAQKHEGDVDAIDSDPGTAKAVFFLQMNIALFNSLKKVYAGYEEVYEYLTGETWVFQDRKAGATSAIPEEERKAILTQLLRREGQEDADENAGPEHQEHAALYRGGAQVG